MLDSTTKVFSKKFKMSIVFQFFLFKKIERLRLSSSSVSGAKEEKESKGNSENVL